VVRHGHNCYADIGAERTLTMRLIRLSGMARTGLISHRDTPSNGFGSRRRRRFKLPDTSRVRFHLYFRDSANGCGVETDQLNSCGAELLFDFLQFVWSQVTSPKICEIFRRSQGHKSSIRKVLTNLTQKFRSERPCGAVLYEKFRKSHRAQARIRKDHFIFDVTHQSAVRIE
jgi:hypothetical protein